MRAQIDTSMAAADAFCSSLDQRTSAGIQQDESKALLVKLENDKTTKLKIIDDMYMHMMVSVIVNVMTFI
jgi:hypothetical protein